MNTPVIGYLLPLTFFIFSVMPGACGNEGPKKDSRARNEEVSKSERDRKVETRQWPALPSNPESAELLIAASTKRQPKRNVALPNGEQLRSLIVKRYEQGKMVAGWPAIIKTIREELDNAAAAGKNGYLLWGTYHDSEKQLEAFRRLVGPLGIGGLTVVTLENFDAQGSWANINAKEQRGDSELLTRWLDSGEDSDMNRIFDHHKHKSYTAWKYGHLLALTDIIVTARATGLKVVGCDMPKSIQRRMGGVGEEAVLRLRELHCALSLEQQKPLHDSPVRVAMLWGQDHVKPEGVRRFFDKSSKVLPFYVHGARASRRWSDPTLAVIEPIMFPLENAETERIFVLPDPRGGVRVERTRVPKPTSNEDRKQRLVITSSRPGVIRFAGHGMEVNENPKSIGLTENLNGNRIGGFIPFIYDDNKTLIVGSLEIPAVGRLEVHIDSEQGIIDFKVFE